MVACRENLGWLIRRHGFLILLVAFAFPILLHSVDSIMKIRKPFDPSGRLPKEADVNLLPSPWDFSGKPEKIIGNTLSETVQRYGGTMTGLKGFNISGPSKAACDLPGSKAFLDRGGQNVASDLCWPGEEIWHISLNKKQVFGACKLRVEGLDTIFRIDFVSPIDELDHQFFISCGTNRADVRFRLDFWPVGTQVQVMRGTVMLLVASVFVYAATLCSRLQVCFQNASHPSLAKQLLSWMSKLRFAPDEHILRESNRLRHQYANKCIVAACPLLLLWFGFLSVYYNFLQEEGFNDIIGSDLFPTCFGALVFLCLYCRPKRFETSRSLDSANFLLSIMWIWRYSTQHRAWYEDHACIIWTARIMQGLIFGNSRFTIVLHGAVTVFDIICHAAHGFRAVGQAQTGYVLSQIRILALVAILTRSFEDVMKSEAKALVEARRANSGIALVHRLLGVLSDAVVHLDAEVRITKPSRNLTDLRLCPSSENSMVGQQFQNLLVAEDRERFVSFLNDAKAQNSENYDAPSRAIHVKMFDNDSNSFAVEIFASFVASVDSDSCFLIGIKEETEDGRPIPDHHGSIDLPVDLRIVDQGRTRDHSILESHGESISSLAQSSASSDDVSAMGYFTVEPAFRFMLLELAMSKTLILLDYSSAFAAMFGPSITAGFKLSDWIKKRDLKRFTEFAISAVENFSDGETSQNQKGQILVEIRPSHLESSKLRIVAHVEVEPAYREQDRVHLEARGCEDVPTLATLKHCTWKMGKSEEGASRRRSRSIQSVGANCGRIGTFSL